MVLSREHHGLTSASEDAGNEGKGWQRREEGLAEFCFSWEGHTHTHTRTRVSGRRIKGTPVCSVNSLIQKRHRSQSQACFLFWGLLTCILLLLKLDPGGWAEFHGDYGAEGQEGTLGEGVS